MTEKIIKVQPYQEADMKAFAGLGDEISLMRLREPSYIHRPPADFMDIELHALVYNAALGIAIKSDRRWEKITRLMYSRDPRQRKRGYRLFDKG